MRKILIIDDEVDIVEILSLLLAEMGFECHSVGNIDAAMELIRKNSDDYFAIFSDWKMPGRKGDDLFEYLRHTAPSLIKRFVLITGALIHDELEARVLKEGAQILRKPFVLNEVKEVINTVQSDALK